MEVAALEFCFQRQSSPHESVQDLKQEVNKLRSKLENYEHLSWLALHPPPVMDPSEGAVRQPLGPGYHRRSQEAKQIICDKFLRLWFVDVVLTKETCQLLREPTFDNWQWEDEEMLVLMQQMYLELELPRKFDIEINILRNFLVRVYHNYNDVPFHNFRHCFCVTQMMFGMARTVNLAERIGDLETLILLTSCICHDLDHPGYNNIYQINAQTELALRYNDISPLENHHCSVAFRILEDPECNIFRNLSGEMFKRIREGMIRCILATDMARHNEIVNQFREVVPYFDRNNKVHVNLLSMVLIKVADISNEARPMNVAEPWLDCLLAEFFQQSDTEKLEGLPVTPFMDREKITKPSSQCSFIGLVLLPLFEALGSFFAELDPMIIQPVRDALEYYRRLNEATQPPRHRKSTDVTAMQAVNVGAATTTTTSQTASDKLPSDPNIISKVDTTIIPSSLLPTQQQ
ncbi:High affinity cGMP-specific 3',5'-cyclic phosphodiesterase 9A [Orchesella cincta]|uniref:Phosphodiesterase n=1 Tax=Orchesella cincta TaxID=48709 RepID=A0A1D2NLP8_ORCCI|nr:High affinity cGMP-specific 3',5'-cyclic phosphodiesterase 9A [Orchesella cincta]